MSEFVDYTLKITGTKPSAIPMARLALYLAEYSKLLGSVEDVHFSHLAEGSAEIHAIAPMECLPVISPRVRSAPLGDVSSPVHMAWKRINELLGEDGWSAQLPLPRSGEVIAFPGRTATSRAIRTVTQSTTIQGRLIRMEGGGDTVHVGLETDGDLSARVSVSAQLADDLVSHWRRYVRLTGDGRWKRSENGRWVLDRLYARSFEPLDDADVGEVLNRLRKMVEPGSGKDIIAAVDELRRA